jgi:glycine cleavage system T protein (aminomethyltransferase)
MVAVQGPLAVTILQSLQPMHNSVPYDLSDLTFGHSRWLTFRDAQENVTPAILVSRTGYTGEDGFELSIPHPEPSENATERMTQYLLQAGSDKIKLAGLGARDVLRLEAGLCLYGNDLNEDTTPVQGSIAWIIPKTRRTGDAGFKGANVLYGPEAQKAGRKRVGLKMEQQTVARHGMRVLNADDSQQLGSITSGAPSPHLKTPIAMASVKSEVKVGDSVAVEIRNKLRKAEVVKMPFVPTKYYKGKS